MTPTFDRNLFTQIGLDSGSLTMLGTVAHSFSEPGEYRGVVHLGEKVAAVFAVSSDKSSPNASATIDLQSLVSGAAGAHPAGCACCKGHPAGDGGPRRFVVNPRGYTLFHISGGAGGYYVHIRRTDAPPEDKGYDTRSLAAGDIFTAIVLRPGSYTIENTHTKARGTLVVGYPKRGEKRYRPPGPLRVKCGPRSFDPNRLEIQPGQGVIFEVGAPARIQIRLEKPDDGPGPETPPQRRAGWTSNAVR
jgi:hypothetical protein